VFWTGRTCWWRGWRRCGRTRSASSSERGTWSASAGAPSAPRLRAARGQTAGADGCSTAQLSAAPGIWSSLAGTAEAWLCLRVCGLTATVRSGACLDKTVGAQGAQAERAGGGVEGGPGPRVPRPQPPPGPPHGQPGKPTHAHAQSLDDTSVATEGSCGLTSSPAFSWLGFTLPRRLGRLFLRQSI
jgi:hypothetical protein